MLKKIRRIPNTIDGDINNKNEMTQPKHKKIERTSFLRACTLLYSSESDVDCDVEFVAVEFVDVKFVDVEFGDVEFVDVDFGDVGFVDVEFFDIDIEFVGVKFVGVDFFDVVWLKLNDVKFVEFGIVNVCC